MNTISKFLKAHIAGIVSATFLAVSDITNGGITSADQWSVIVGAYLAAFGLVAVIPNNDGSAPAPAVIPQDVVAPAASDVASAIQTVASAIVAPPVA